MIFRSQKNVFSIRISEETQKLAKISLSEMNLAEAENGSHTSTVAGNSI